MPAALANPPSRPLPDALSRLPANEQASFQAALHEARHSVEALSETQRSGRPELRGVSHCASNPGQDLMFGFLQNGGVRLQSGQAGKTWEGTLRLVRKPASAASWQAAKTRAELDHDGLTEWYLNRTEGMEHGFTLAEHPAEAAAGGPVVLRLDLEGLRAAADPSRPGDLVFTDPATEEPVLGYRDLKVWDAAGQPLAAEMRPSGGGFLIAVNDSTARYPITVDPLIVSLESVFQRTLGLEVSSCAIDGNWLVLGVVDADSGQGAAYLFERQTGWWFFRQKLLPAVRAAGSRFGHAVAIDGNTAVVTTLGDSQSVYVFVRSGDSWLPQDFPARFSTNLSVGHAVALDGDRLVVGAPSGVLGSNGGTVFVYDRSGTTWPATGSSFNIPALAPDSNLGYSVAVEGDLIVAGAPAFLSGTTGQAFLLRKTGAVWEEPLALPAQGLSPDDAFGASVDIAGGMIAVGAPGRDYSSLSLNSGRVHCFTGSGSAWAETSTISSPAPQANQQFGLHLSLAGDHLAVAGINRNTLFSNSADGAWRVVYDGPSQPSTVGVSGALAIFAPSMNSIVSVVQAGGTWKLELGSPLTFGIMEDHFGLSVDVDGEFAVVGSLDYDDQLSASSGKAWVFQRRRSLLPLTGNPSFEPVWVHTQPLSNPGAAAGDRFGVSVAISGNRVVVGADFDDEPNSLGAVKADCGSATVFERSSSGAGWNVLRKFSSEQSAGDSFGRAVAIDGTTIAIGAPGANSGRGLVWTYAGASFYTQAVSASSPQVNALFGFSVALSGPKLVVGAPRTDIASGPLTAADTGRVYFFKPEAVFGLWTADGENSPLQANAQAGFSVAIDGDVAVVGCSGPSGWAGNSNDAGRTGKAFVVTHDGTAWSSSFQYLDASDLPAGAWFGMSVAVDDGTIAVGAFGNNTVEGKVRLFRREGSSWTKQTDIVANGAAEPDNAFGVSTALSGDTLLVGGYGADSLAGAGAGTAWVYRIGGTGPALTITRSGSNAVLSWPATPGWTLQRSATLLPGSWQPVAVTTDGSHTHPIVAGQPRMFFRLEKP